MDMTKVFLIALIGESLWETAKLFWQKGKLNIDKVGAVLVSIMLTIVTGLDIFELLGFNISIPVLGEVLTGVLISRGANFIHDILGSVGNLYSKSKGDTNNK